MLDNVFRFKYLGSTFTADGNQHFDIDERIAQAMQRCGTLRHVFGSPSLSLSLKLRLYVAAVCSVLIYGCETWTLDDKTIRRINGGNSRMLIRITGRPIRDEARSLTTSHDLVRQIRKLRLRWLGEILRSGPSRLIYQAIKVQWDGKTKGNLFTDAPETDSLMDLAAIAHDKMKWASLVSKI